MSDNEDDQGADNIYENDCEDFEDYKRDGYHPVYLGERFMNERYTVLQKLGWGHFSTVWLAEDRQYGQPNSNSKEKYVALKIQKSKESYSEAAQDEIQILKALKEAKKKPEWAQAREELKAKGMNLGEDDTYCIEILNNFPHFGIHGKHFCTTFHIMGPNLLDLIRFFEKEYNRGIPLFIVKKIAIQLLIGLDYMHRMGQVIHTDLKPENVMIDLPVADMAQFIEDLKKLKTLPLSMKYLKSVQSASSKNKKKKKKKKTADNPSNTAKSETEADKDNESIESDISSAQTAPPLTFKNPADTTESTFDNSKAINELEETTLPANSSFKKSQAGEGPSLISSTSNADNKLNEEPLHPAPQAAQELSKITPDSNNHAENGQKPHNGNEMANELDNVAEKELPQPVPSQTLANNTKESISVEGGQKLSSSVEIIEQANKPKSKPQKELDRVEGEFSKEDDDSEGSGSSSSGSESSETQRKRKQSYESKKEFTFYWKGKVKVVLNEDIKIKIVDFGNACWTYKHFTDNIQTREYRSPEAIVGSKYDANTDIWSFACMLFELITGDYLFRPHSSRREPRDELHIALFISTLGKFPKKLALDGKYSRELFNKNGKLLHAEVPDEYTLDQILTSEYDFPQKDAEEIRDFLLPMLEYDIEKRISAHDALKSPWLWK